MIYLINQDNKYKKKYLILSNKYNKKILIILIKEKKNIKSQKN